MKLQRFFSELESIINKHPRIPPAIFNSENCDYGSNIYYSSNLFFAFDDANCTDSQYIYDSYMCPSCVDCDYCAESELCYESVDAFKCFNSSYIEYCGHITDSMYVYDSMNCHDVFGCANLQNKSFCIFNRQLTEEEYKQKIGEYKKMPAEKALAMLEEVKSRYPLTQTYEAHNDNSSYGNYSHYNKNCYLSFDAAHNENCSYLYDSFHNKTCYDMTYASQNNQVSYEIVDSGNLFNCAYALYCNACNDSSYIVNCNNVKDCLGCYGLTNKQYCILNRQLTQEEYEKVKLDLFSQLREEKTGWNNLYRIF